MVSRLTYTNTTSHAGELFGRVEHLSGFFIKGYGGLSVPLNSGRLQDEYFPPLPGEYSSTNSDQHNGKLDYLAIDAGWEWRSEQLRLGAFGGYFHYFASFNAFGCTQTAGNPFVCVPPIPTSVLAITSTASWNAIRLGGSAQWRFAPGWAISAELAWLPKIRPRPGWPQRSLCSNNRCRSDHYLHDGMSCSSTKRPA